jgi:hypothetical protein
LAAAASWGVILAVVDVDYFVFVFVFVVPLLLLFCYWRHTEAAWTAVPQRFNSSSARGPSSAMENSPWSVDITHGRSHCFRLLVAPAATTSTRAKAVILAAVC